MVVLFDIGSTLLEGPPVGPARRIAEALGLPRTARAEVTALLFRTPSASPEELAERLSRHFDLPPARARDATARLWRAQLEEAYPIPGAAEALARLREAGIARAYLSNIWPPFHARFEREFPEEAGRPQFLSFRMGLMKPDPAFYRRALSDLGVEAADAVMVGDTYANDIQPALALGLRSVWVLHRPDKERQDLTRVLNGEAPAPTLTLGSIGELTPERLSALPGKETGG